MTTLRQLNPQIRKISTKAASHQKSHYDALGISSKATQADVKSAYYKLSKEYHPDKNENSTEAAKKFHAITEAYEVLGNVKSRKIYDRGLYFASATSTYAETPMGKFYKSRETKSRPPAAQGRTTVYDFDEWSRSHYGATFRRDMRYKEQQMFKRQRAKQTAEDVKSEKVVLLVGMLLLIGGYLLFDKDYDTVQNVAVFGATDFVTKPKTD